MRALEKYRIAIIILIRLRGYSDTVIYAHGATFYEIMRGGSERGIHSTHLSQLFNAILNGLVSHSLMHPSEVLVGRLPENRDSPLGGALQFFFYDTPKVLMLRKGIVFVDKLDQMLVTLLEQRTNCWMRCMQRGKNTESITPKNW